ncbi:MAG: DUF1801 domain-containing protein [Sandaracinaceae bacterium]|nr:DUF1801 domain-containing protein [Sandaracinaceae bacterium]
MAYARCVTHRPAPAPRDPEAPLFLLPGGSRRDPAIDAWIATRRRELQPLVERWFGHARGCGDDVRERMHDGCPTVCVGDAAFAYVGAYTHHVSIGFFMGALLDDPQSLLEGTGKRGRHVKLRPACTHDERGLKALLDAAYVDMCARVRALETGGG